MNDQDDRLNTMVSRLARVRDEELAFLSVGPAAQALFQEVVSVQKPTRTLAVRRSPRRFAALSVAAGTVAILALGVMLGSTLIGSPEAAGLAFRSEDGYIVAEVTDPMAATEQLSAAFAEHGLDIDLQLVPVSPSIVGTVVAIGEEGTGGIETLQGGTCVTGGGGCPIGLRIPADYEGDADITLGRDAEPGEQFLSAADGFGPGEALHCSGLLGATVEDALEAIDARALTAVWRLSDGSDVDPATVSDYFVTEAIPWAGGEVLMWVATEPVTPPAEYLQAINQDC